jgi:hypothetical protein
VKLIDLTGQKFGRLTVIGRAAERMYGKHVAWICRCDCGEATTTIGTSLRKGAVKSCGCFRRNDHAFITYEAAHLRVSQSKGSAAQHDCVDCGATAHDWSYDHLDTVECVCRRRFILYSLNPQRYQPRCRPCHKQHDMNRRGVADSKPQTQTNTLTK